MSTDYERYIRTDELLDLQKPAAMQINHDELLFQATHQASELWMKAMLQDISEAVRLMRVAAGELHPPQLPAVAASNQYPPLYRATHLLKRSARILRSMTEQILILEMIAPSDYHQIRLALGRGSGQDSPGFNYLLKMAHPLQEAYQAVLEQRGTTPVAILGNPYEQGELFDLIQALLDFDEHFSRFRQSHLHLVRREIGLDVLSLKGAPAHKLQAGTQALMFGDLWDAIEQLTNSYSTTY